MTVKGPSSAVPSGSPTSTVLFIATPLLSIMLSRFSSLFTYVIVGLVISAAATPLNNPLGDALGDGTKSLSRPQPMMKSYDKGKPYDDDRRRPYDDDGKRKPYDDDGKRMPYDDDKDKSYRDDKDKSYGDKGKHYGSERHGQCSIENQQCCNQVNQVNHIHPS